jgi:hypothetical protein
MTTVRHGFITNPHQRCADATTVAWRLHIAAWVATIHARKPTRTRTLGQVEERASS